MMDLALSPLEQSKQFEVKGDEANSTGDKKAAVLLYNKALCLPELTPDQSSRLLEKRARCCFELSVGCTRTINIYENLALKDAFEATNLNESSWQGHNILYLIFKGRPEHEENAEFHLERAKELAPDPELIEYDLPSSTSISPETGDPMKDEQFEFLNVDKLDNLYGSDLVNTGHKYRQGSGVPQNTREAAIYYEKAAELGNAKGIYFLAQLYLQGIDKPLDIPKALELLEKAGNMEPFPVNLDGTVVEDMGVQIAQHCLGVLYEDGEVIEQNYKKAMNWFKKSAESGFGPAFNNVAFMYNKGKGVEKNWKMAEMYWKVAVKKGSEYAAFMLHHHYLGEVEPEAAMVYFKAALELGLEELEIMEDTAKEDAGKIMKRRMEAEGSLIEFEKKWEFNRRGFTFDQRMRRMQRVENPRVEALLKMGKVSKKEVMDKEEEVAKEYLKDPGRRWIIKKFRKGMGRDELPEGKEEDEELPEGECENELGIVLIEMSPVKSKIYSGKMLKLRIIEEVKFEGGRCLFVGEDEVGDVILVEIMGVDEVKNEKFKFGTELVIRNPKFITDKKKPSLIRVENQEFIEILNYVIEMCRFCGRAEAPHKCAKCKWARYCSRECQKNDWKVLEHKLICC